MGNVNIIAQLDANAKFLKEVQDDLRKFVLDKKNPIKDRFRVWDEYCEKVDEPYVIHNGEYGIIGKMVDTCFPYEYDKYRNYDYKFYLGLVEDTNKDEYEKDNWKDNLDIPVLSVDKFKEMLIETNFGSFNMDW